MLPSSSEERCTTTIGPPIVDTLIAGAFIPLAYFERNAFTAEGNPATLGRTISATLGVGGVVAVASAVYGYVNAARCSHYQARFHP